MRAVCDCPTQKGAQETAMNNQYGMYGILETIFKLSKVIQQCKFTAKELSQQTGLSQNTISKNLSRLVELGLLEKIESTQPNKSNNPNIKPRGACRQVEYKLKEGAFDFIKRNLY